VATTANVSALLSSSKTSTASLTVIGIIVVLLVCGFALIFLRRPPRGPHRHRRQDI
jgi:uncharacterized BrkB/YihY/UPF0761 family membrane protein